MNLIDVFGRRPRPRLPLGVTLVMFAFAFLLRWAEATPNQNESARMVGHEVTTADLEVVDAFGHLAEPSFLATVPPLALAGGVGLSLVGVGLVGASILWRRGDA
jgi:hypothetical protein